MKRYAESTPIQIHEIYKASKISLLFFFIFQICGLYLIYKGATTLISQFDLNKLTNQLASGDPNLKNLSLGTFQMSSIESFISGATFSMTSGFWLSCTWSGLRLQKPYSHKAYRILIWSFYLQLFFFLLSFRGIVLEHKSILNPGTLGSALTIAFTSPVFLKALHKNVKLWSQEYLPPPPQI